MRRRILALVGKELREHAVVLLLLAPLLGLGLALVTLAAVAAKRSSSTLEAGLSFAITFVPLASMALGHRLIVVEWHGRTQLFLEALPIRRWELVAVKYTLGLGLLLAAAWGGIGWAALLASSSEPIGARFLGIMGARTGAYTWCVWSFLFGMGFTGRYRIPIYLGIGLGLLALSQVTELELQHFGPFELVSSATFTGERTTLPTGALTTTAAVAAGWTVAAFALATVREGSVAEVFSRPMSQKEKSVIGALFVVGLVATVELDQRKQKAPYAFTDDAVLRSDAQPIEVLYLTLDAVVDAERLLGELEADRAALAALLPRATLPVVRVALGETLDDRTFETARLSGADGVLVRANFRRPPDAGPDALRPLRARLVRETLARATHSRALFEPRRWLHDGFSRWLVERHAPPGSASPLGDPAGSRVLLLALWASEGDPVTVEHLARWDLRRERLGEHAAEAVAYSGLLALEDLAGRQAVLDLARAEWDRPVHRDLREVLWTRAHPLPDLIERAAGVSLADLVAAWNARLDVARNDPAVRAALDALPAGSGALRVERGADGLPAVAYELEFARPPRPGTLVSLVHCELEPFDRELEQHEVTREEHAWPDGRRHGWRLEGRYGAGSRAFLALEVELEALGVPGRLAAIREEVE